MTRTTTVTDHKSKLGQDPADTVLEYLEILREHGLGSTEAKKFKSRFADDSSFLKKAAFVERLHFNRAALLKSLGESLGETATPSPSSRSEKQTDREAQPVVQSG